MPQINIWMGAEPIPIGSGLTYAQSKLSGRLAVSILSVIAIVEIGYLLVDLYAMVLLRFGSWIGSMSY